MRLFSLLPRQSFSLFSISYPLWGIHRSTARRLWVDVVTMFRDQNIAVVEIRALAGLGPFSLSLGGGELWLQVPQGVWMIGLDRRIFLLHSVVGKGGGAQHSRRRVAATIYTPLAVVTTHPVSCMAMGTTPTGDIFLSSFFYSVSRAEGGKQDDFHLCHFILFLRSSLTFSGDIASR